MRVMVGMLALLASLIGSPALAAEDEGFPGREVFVNLEPIELDQLNANFGSVVVVDVRSRFEYETLHIKGAEHISLYDPAFGKRFRELRQKNPGAAIVTYCNGRTCFKSYKAAEKARAAGIENLRVFDAGIMEWARAHPEKSVLLGESPVDPADLIDGDALAAHMLDPEAFADRVANGNPMVLDIRGPRQRDGVGLFVFKERNISLDAKERMRAYLEKAAASGRPLLVYDMAGKQVRWFQYYLEDLGIENYHFMRGGVKAFFEEVIRG